MLAWSIQFPDAVDAAILTGFTVNSTAMSFFMGALNLEIANQNDPRRFSHLSDGYLVSPNFIGSQFDFFHDPNFTKETLDCRRGHEGDRDHGRAVDAAARLEARPELLRCAH